MRSSSTPLAAWLQTLLGVLGHSSLMREHTITNLYASGYGLFLACLCPGWTVKVGERLDQAC